MALPVYPANLPSASLLNDWELSEPHAPADATEMEAGNTRMRAGPNVGTLAYAIALTPAEFEIFKQFVKVTLRRGAMRFQMPIIFPGNVVYGTKIVWLVDGLYSSRPMGVGHRVSFTLKVVDL